MKKIVMIILIVLTSLIIGGATYLFLSETAPQQQPQPTENVAAKEIEKTISYKPAESIITNIKDSKKYLKISVALEIKDEKALAYFEKNSYKIKDTIINVIRNKTEGELTVPESQETLKTDIKVALDQKIDTKNLMEIYIDEFVIQ